MTRATSRVGSVSARAQARTATASSFDAFYLANMEQLTRSLVATLGSSVKAQDAAQEAMLKAYKRWDQVSSYANPMGWCYRVAINQGRSSWRKSAREDLSGDVPTRPAVDVVDGLDADLIAALLKLPIAQRSVVVLRVFMGWSLEETAEALDVAIGTVSSRYARSMDVLRRSVAVTRPEFADPPQPADVDDTRSEVRR